MNVGYCRILLFPILRCENIIMQQLQLMTRNVRKLQSKEETMKIFNNTNYAKIEILCRNFMEQGGNAVDAAIAGLLCNGIQNAQSMGLGGGFFMVIYNR